MSPVIVPYTISDSSGKRKVSEAPDFVFSSPMYFDATLHKNSVSGGLNFHLDVTDSEGKVTFNGKTYTLRQLHLHHPAENTLENRDRSEFRAEMHFVFVYDDIAANKSEYFVFGALYQNGTSNAEFGKLLDGLQVEMEGEGSPVVWDDDEHEKNEVIQKIPINVADLLGSTLNEGFFVTFKGSLTTKTSSGLYLAGQVDWCVSRMPAFAEWKQLDKLIELLKGKGAARDLQDAAGRTFIEYTLSG